MSWLLVASLVMVAPPRPPSGPPAPPAGQHADSLMVAAQRAVTLWRRHDFTGLVSSGEAIMVHLPGAEPSSALRPSQAAELLRTFADGTQELDLSLLVARNVDPDRAYVEVQRVYRMRGTTDEHTETLYFGFQRVRESYHLVEVRALP